MPQNIDLNKFNFHFPIQMRWSDLDPLGHVNNAMFVTYFEMARGRFMMEAAKGWNWEKDMFLIGSVHVDYLKELKLTSENPQVYMRTSKLGTKSFVLEYVISSDKNGEKLVHAIGSTTQIMFDMFKKSTIEIPDWVRNGLKEFDAIS